MKKRNINSAISNLQKCQRGLAATSGMFAEVDHYIMSLIEEQHQKLEDIIGKINNATPDLINQDK